MRFDFWPLRPVRELLRALESERKALAAERAALAAERAALTAERAALAAERAALAAERAALASRIDAVRDEEARRREALEQANALLSAELDDTRGRLAGERDALVMRRDGLAPVLADASLGQDRRLAVCELAIVEGRVVEVMSVLESLRDDPLHRAMAARGLAMGSHLIKSGLLRDLGWVAPTDAEGASPPALPLPRPLRFSPPDARGVVLAFMGVGNRFWMQIAALHPFLAPLGHHVVYLTDAQFSCFLRGVDAIGPSYETALAGLRSLCATLGQDEPRIYCYGASMGGFGALRYGLDLGARRVLAMETTTSMKGDVYPAPDETWLARKLGDLAVDLRSLYLQAPARPQATLYYGALNGRDAAHAERFADVPGARVVAVEGSGDHDCVKLAHRRRTLRGDPRGISRHLTRRFRPAGRAWRSLVCT